MVKNEEKKADMSVIEVLAVLESVESLVRGRCKLMGYKEGITIGVRYSISLFDAAVCPSDAAGRISYIDSLVLKGVEQAGVRDAALKAKKEEKAKAK